MTESDKDIDKLSRVIAEEVPGELSLKESIVDTAIRLIRESQKGWDQDDIDGIMIANLLSRHTKEKLIYAVKEASTP